jgi:hypothetical protein
MKNYEITPAHAFIVAKSSEIYIPNMTNTKLEKILRKNLTHSLFIHSHGYVLKTIDHNIRQSAINNLQKIVFGGSFSRCYSIDSMSTLFVPKKLYNHISDTIDKKYIFSIVLETAAGTLIDYALETEMGQEITKKYNAEEKKAKKALENVLGNGFIMENAKAAGGTIKRHLPQIITFFVLNYVFDKHNSTG